MQDSRDQQERGELSSMSMEVKIMKKYKRKTIHFDQLYPGEVLLAAVKAVEQISGVKMVLMDRTNKKLTIQYELNRCGLEEIYQKLKECGITPDGKWLRKLLHRIELFMEKNEKKNLFSKPSCCSKPPRKP